MRYLRFFVVIGITLVIPLSAAFYKYYYKQDYDYLVEAPCEPANETCHTRDCSTEECPPNGLSDYKIFTVKAYDFAKCKKNSCKEECEKELIYCTPILCVESEGDSCTKAN